MVGQEHRQLEPDGSYTKLKTTFHDLVAFRGAAEHGYKQLAKRDYFIAEDHIHQFLSPKTGRQEEQFIATGLDMTWPVPATWCNAAGTAGASSGT